MIGILVGAWVFCMVSFCVLGIGCRMACRGRRARGGACICGRHPEERRVVTASRSGRVPIPAAVGPSRFRVAEARVRSLQQRYVDGRLSMEQYEVELDKVVGLA